jgi:Family of unknown function (DUF5719)
MSRPGDHDDDEGQFDPFSEDDDPFRPQRPLRDPFRPDLDPYPIPDDPFQLEDPFQRPEEDPYSQPADPYGPPPRRTGGYQPDQGPPGPAPGSAWGSPPPPPPRQEPGRPDPPPGWPPPQPGGERPEQAPGGATASEQRPGGAIPSRAARHQQKRRGPWRLSRGQGTPGPIPGPAPGPGGAGGPAAAEPEGERRGEPRPREPRGGEPRRGIRLPGRPSAPPPGPPRPERPERPERRPGEPPGSPVWPPGPPPAARGGQPQPGSRTGQFGRIPGAPGGPGRGAAPGPQSGDRGGGPRPGGGPGGPAPGRERRPGGTTGSFDAVPGERRPGRATGSFDAVPGERRPGETTGSFEAYRPERSGSTGELPRGTANGRAEETAVAAEPGGPSRAERSARRSRFPQQARQLPGLPRFEVPTGLARTTLGLVGILVLAAAGLGVVTSALPRAKPPATPAAAAPYSARWICPLLPNQNASIGVANVGGDPATLRTTVVGGETASQPAQKPLEPGGLRTLDVPGAKQPGYVQVEAFSSPVAVGSGGQAGCAAGPTDRWWLPAADTSLGASTAVVIANPDNDPAVVDLVPHVNQGALAAAAELFVPPRSAKVQTLSNGELIALKPAIEVIAKSGRVVAGAVIDQKDEQKIVVPGQPTTRPEWTFAGGLSGPDRSTSVLITNPSANPLSVSVQVSTDQGTFRPGNDFDNPIPGGSSASIQVPPLRSKGSGAFALRISSRDGADFVAALRVSAPTPSGDVTYLDLGTGGSDRSWFVPQIPTSRQVVLANLGGGPVSARLGKPGSGSGGGSVQVGPGKVVVRQVPGGAKSLEVSADQPGLLVAPLLGGLSLAGAEIGGLPAGGPVVEGQAAA